MVVAYNMHREIARTLYSLDACYQKDVRPDEYEVIVVEMDHLLRLSFLICAHTFLAY